MSECACGCGQRLRSAQRQFVRGHNSKRPRHADYGRHNRGYRWLGRKLEHVVMAELALGKPLPAGAQVHHVNGDRSDNRPQNLVVCQDRAYHALLHRRADARDAGVPLNWIRCGYCGQFEDPARLYVRPNGKGFHRSCRRNRDVAKKLESPS